jgi:hypothetical protein
MCRGFVDAFGWTGLIFSWVDALRAARQNLQNFSELFLVGRLLDIDNLALATIEMMPAAQTGFTLCT